MKLPLDIIIIIYKHCDMETKINLNRIFHVNYRYMNPYKNNLSMTTYIELHKYARNYYKHGSIIVYNIMRSFKRDYVDENGYLFLYIMAKNDIINWYKQVVYEECTIICKCNIKCYNAISCY
jgi:hypothetical protein